mmetsp:Transcript_41609/g.64933  ORF Transcript_41609/g.64933 Transcript_41609/m.64933 type:complete len:106 (+) Transcript_41609:261-578(+)|eukprot:CAMPEP_0184321950 /NCGR_PEP_ID=MMETSP1049-20130417/122006_1 /TAXON_ID=77928 /ORGANISM="Proteomonas sulcata, Strain CCMP704" /LENGTH=105 /DNA_ID=CAMNT_0026642935 /DNA_START=205 /DNA_END=522 /DNA_ORIENTATION=+
MSGLLKLLQLCCGGMRPKTKHEGEDLDISTELQVEDQEKVRSMRRTDLAIQIASENPEIDGGKIQNAVRKAEAEMQGEMSEDEIRKQKEEKERLNKKRVGRYRRP